MGVEQVPKKESAEKVDIKHCWRPNPWPSDHEYSALLPVDGVFVCKRTSFMSWWIS